jgi:hypothetical protein
MDDQSEAYDEYTVLSLNELVEAIELKQHIEPIELKEPIDNENPELMEPMEKPMESIELKEPIESIMELKERIEDNAEAHDECTLIDDPVDIEDAKSEAYDECKLLLP